MDGEAVGEVNWMRCSGIEAWGESEIMHRGRRRQWGILRRATKANSQQRNLPAKGFRPGILLLGMGAVMGYGWYKLIGGMREAKYVCPSPSSLHDLQPISTNDDNQ
jgi:hypothetical protein